MMHFFNTILKLNQCQNSSKWATKSNFIVLAAILDAIFIFIWCKTHESPTSLQYGAWVTFYDSFWHENADFWPVQARYCRFVKWSYPPLPPFWIMRIAQGWQGCINWILMFEGVGYHNQLKHFLYTTNPCPVLHLPDYIPISFALPATRKRLSKIVSGRIWRIHVPSIQKFSRICIGWWGNFWHFGQ